AEIREAGRGADRPPALHARRLQAIYLARQARFAEAEAMARDVLARADKLWPGRGIVGAANNAVGLVLQAQSRYAEAEPYFRAALAVFESTTGPDSIQVAV